MKLTRRALGEAVVAAAVALPLARAQTSQETSQTSQRDWLAEARAGKAAAVRAIAGVAVPMAVEPATQFRA